MSELIMGTWGEEEHGGKTVCQLYVDDVTAISDFLANPYRRNAKFYAVVCELELTLQEKEENNGG